MNRKTTAKFSLAAIAIGALLLFVPAAFAADAEPAAEATTAEAGATTGHAVFLSDTGAGKLGGAIGAGLVIMGGAAGVARVGSSAVESMARQPEAAGQINTAMIITAAMVEGATLFAVVVAMLAVL